jgi:uncharacterized protein YcbK (DUF882 family)
MHSGPSPHFSWQEFRCRDRIGSPYPNDWMATRAVELATELELLRLEIGPFSPTSVFRTWTYHAGIYARMKPPQTPPKLSQHLFGRAADVACPDGMEWPDFVRAVIRVAKRDGGRVRFVKFYPGDQFAHLDTRPTASLLIEGA